MTRPEKGAKKSAARAYDSFNIQIFIMIAESDSGGSAVVEQIHERLTEIVVVPDGQPSPADQLREGIP
jgi:hypothetical protein